MEKVTNKFEFKIAGDSEQPAIWFKLQEREVFIYPLRLYGLLWQCNEKTYFAPGITAELQIFSDEVYGIYYDDSCGTCKIEHDKQAFIDSAIMALNDLCKYTIKNRTCFYPDFTVKTAESLLTGIENLRIPNNYNQIFYDEICHEEFSFKFVEAYSCDTAYEIRIGRQIYPSFLSDWTTDFNQLRNEMESFVLYPFFEKHKIHLHFEDSPTILMLQTRSLFPQNTRHPEVIKITVLSDTFSKLAPVFGWCSPRKIIRSLYMELLHVFTIEPEDFDDRFETWDNFRLKSYNQLQSCIIENYINEIDNQEQVFFARNRVLHSVEEMQEDFKQLETSLKPW